MCALPACPVCEVGVFIEQVALVSPGLPPFFLAPHRPAVTHRKIQLQTYNPKPDSAAITVCPFFSLATRQRETCTLLGASFHLKESDRSAVALVGRSGAVGGGRSAIKDGGRTCVYKRSPIQIAAGSILPTV